MKIYLYICLIGLGLNGCSEHLGATTEDGNCNNNADNGELDCVNDDCITSTDCSTEQVQETGEDDQEAQQPEDSEETQPEQDAEDNSYDPTLIGNIESGRDVFLTYCADCHGDDGQSGDAPRLSGEVPDKDDETLWKIIVEGEDDMPSVDLDSQQVADVIAWLRSIFQ